jgi:protoporphyrinogen IX oxidase
LEIAIPWLKIVHIAAVLFWSAGLVYLPGLFAAHPGAKGEAYKRLRLITRFTYIAVTSPAAVVAILSGAALIFVAGAHGGWLVLKLALVSLLVVHHVLLGRMTGWLRDDPRMWRPAAHLSLIAVPAVLVPPILWLVLGKPV